MDAAIAHRFETEFAPRIVDTIAGIFDGHVQAAIIAADGSHPLRVRLTGTMNEHLRHHPHPLHIDLTWDEDEIENLLTMHESDAHFRRYLEAIPRKLRNWQDARPVDFTSRTQADPSILIGGLDFNA
ncbi:hypothetical protein FAZ69_25705 [Trinickia terrae]|uniref:DUF5594 domain-containing protein n=1 Tax=Trinickia terrae TaxID=2571161 RepID=A0A4U1HRU7_9BURK|nr:DUF5594 family protein [Trinickia terrae]TKC83093.1 hypothetical protein FAZ69_25705 [Trinickia terrae]